MIPLLSQLDDHAKVKGVHPWTTLEAASSSTVYLWDDEENMARLDDSGGTYVYFCEMASNTSTRTSGSTHNLEQALKLLAEFVTKNL